MRTSSVIERCKECGSATRFLHYDQDADESGDPSLCIYATQVPHPKRACDAMVALAREEWPTLF